VDAFSDIEDLIPTGHKIGYFRRARSSQSVTQFGTGENKPNRTKPDMHE